MCLLSIFRVFSFPYVVLLGIDMPLVGAPSVRVKRRNAKRLKEFLPSLILDSRVVTFEDGVY
jgi:hypothetical protein